MKETIVLVGIVFGLSVDGAVAFGAATPSTPSVANVLGREAPDSQATQRYIAGVITQVDTRTVTIHGKTAVQGRVNESTRVTIDGRAGKASDLKVTANAKAEIGLDDVWATIAVSTK